MAQEIARVAGDEGMGIPHGTVTTEHTPRDTGDCHVSAADLDRRAVALGVARCLNTPIGINVLLGMIAQCYQLSGRTVDSQLTANCVDMCE